MIKSLFLSIINTILKITYLPFKLLRTDNKIVFMSRQFNYPNLDFVLLSEQIKKDDPNVKIVFMCKKLEKGIINKIKYMWSILVSMYHLATSRVCIVDTYIIQVSILNHKKSLKIIQIWHALGTVKKFGHQTIGKTSGSSAEMARGMNMHKNYDYAIAPGKETANFFSKAFNINVEKVKLIGMPRVDYILKECPDVDEMILSKYPMLKGKKNVLYVPTFRKNKLNNMDEICDKFDFENYNLVVKYHPVDISKDQKNKENKVIVIDDENINIYDLYKLCDIILTDYSTVSLEASLLNKPIYFYLYDYEEYKNDPGLDIDPYIEMRQASSFDFDTIMEWIKQDSYDISWIKSYKEKYFDIDLNKNCTELLSRFVLDLKQDIKRD